MRVVIHTPFVEAQVIRGDNDVNASLGKIFSGEARVGIERVFINGTLFPEWWLFVPGDKDQIDVYTRPGYTGGVMLVMMLVSLAMSFIMQALAPEPSQPSDRRPQPAFGIAGITNTIAPGTVKFLVYGKRRVFGFLLASRVDLKKKKKKTGELYRRMEFSVVYFMGAGPIKHITEPKLGDGGTKYEDFPGEFSYDTRLGTEDQEIFPKHRNVHQTYRIQKTIPIPSEEEDDANEPIVETTRGEVDEVTIFFAFPTGIFGVDQMTGATTSGYYHFKIDYKKNSSTKWITGLKKVYKAATKDGLFAGHTIEFEEKGRYDIRIQCIKIKMGSQQSGAPAWFNLMETQYITTAYPGLSLMEVSGIATQQFQSIEELRISGLVCGRVIPVWDEDSQMIVRNWTNSRAWITRDVLTDPKHGLGSAFSEDMVDDGSLIRASTNWEYDQVQGYDGLEDRDHCDVILGIDGARPGWEVIKNLCYEGETRYLPIRGRLTYVIDRGGDPMRYFADPGNVMEGSVTMEFGRNDKTANTIKATYADELDNYKEIPGRLVRRAGLGTERERLEEVRYISITRESQAARLMRKTIEKIDLVDRFWRFQTGNPGMRTYPTQVIRLTYRTLGDMAGVSSIVCEGSTQQVIQLDRIVELLPGVSYRAYIFHKLNDKLEDRTITTPAGRWGTIVLGSAFTQAVKVGDIITIGDDSQSKYVAVVDSNERTSDSMYDIKCSLYVPSVYEPDDPLPHVSDLINASEAERAPQQPIRAQLVNKTFKVAPGFSVYRGTTQAIKKDYVTLANKEPAIDDFFNDYEIEIEGRLRSIIDYDGATRRAYTSSAVGISDQTKTYRLIKPESGAFNGFSVERSASPDGPWTFVGSTLTTSLTVNSLTPGSDYFRITPISPHGIENTVGRWIIQNGTPAADTTEPDAPTSVVAISTGKDATVDVTFDYPLARDVWKINIELNENSPTGTNRASAEIDISAQRDEDNTDDEGSMSAAFDLADLAEGTLLYVRTNIEDYFGNVSEWVQAPNAIDVGEDDEEEDVGEDTNANDVTVENTTDKTTIASARITGGRLGLDGYAELGAFMRVTDDSPTHDATLTIRLEYDSTVLVSMACRTSDLLTNIGSDKAWKVVGYIGAKNSATTQLAVLEKLGADTLTDVPYPGKTARLERALPNTINTDKRGTLKLTLEWSDANPGLSAVKEFSWHKIIPGAEG